MNWRVAARCYNEDVDLDIFFPVGKSLVAMKQTQEAITFCKECQSRKDCLEFALESGEKNGIWGGVAPDERESIVRKWRHYKQIKVPNSEAASQGLYKGMADSVDFVALDQQWAKTLAAFEEDSKKKSQKTKSEAKSETKTDG